MRKEFSFDEYRKEFPEKYYSIMCLLQEAADLIKEARYGDEYFITHFVDNFEAKIKTSNKFGCAPVRDSYFKDCFKK